jgi:hypothetical protein
MQQQSNPDPFRLDTRFQLPKFVGKMNGEVVDSWIHNISTYFRTCTGLTEERKLQIATLQLEGLAQTWWDTQLENTTLVVDIGASDNSSESPIKTWEQFCQALRDCFYPPRYLQNLWTRWLQLRNYLHKMYKHTLTTSASFDSSFTYQIQKRY